MDRDRLITPFLMWGIVIAGGLLSYLLLPKGLLYQPGNLHFALFALALLHWLILFVSSIYHHRQVMRSAARVEKLVTSGPYRYVRHPIYWGDVVAFWGASIAYPAPWLIATAIWAAIMMFSWASFEEKALEKRFGTAYSDYRKRTPMLLPDYAGAVSGFLTPKRK